MTLVSAIRRSTTVLLVCVLGASGTAAAQQDSVWLKLLAEQTLSAATDTLVVPLRRQGAYRITVTPSMGVLSVRQLRFPARPIIRPVPDSLGKVDHFDIQAPQDGPYAVMVTERSEPVVVRVYSDVVEAERMQQRGLERRKRSWAVGLMAGAGAYSAYDVGVETPGLAEGGVDWELGVTVAQLSGLGGSLTYGAQGRGAGRDIGWITAEVRGRFLRTSGLGNRTLALGAVFRGGIGNLDGKEAAVTVFGPGLFVSQALTEDAAGRGVLLDGSYQFGVIGDTDEVADDSAPKSRTQHRVALTVRWLP